MPETISIKKPSTDDQNDVVIIPDNEKVEISKSLIKTDFQIKDSLKWKKKEKQKTIQKIINKRKFTGRS